MLELCQFSIVSHTYFLFVCCCFRNILICIIVASAFRVIISQLFMEYRSKKYRTNVGKNQTFFHHSGKSQAKEFLQSEHVHDS